MTLSRALLFLLLAIAGTGAQAGEKTLSNFSPWEKPLPNRESDPLRHAIVEAWEALDRGDAAAAAASFNTVLADPRLASQPDDWQRDVHAGAGTAALQLDRNEVALRHFRAATANPANTAYDWQQLVLLEYLDDRLEPAARALRTLATRWPEIARDTNKVLVGQLIYRLSASTAISGEMIEAMLQAGWTPDVGGESGVAYRLALAQVIAGRRDAARRTLEAVDDPDSLLMVRADPRFDGLYEVSDLRWDVGAAARRRVSDLRAEAILAPEQLEPVSALANAMLVVGDHEDLIAMVDEVKATIAQATAGKPPYRDAGEHLPWLLNTRSIALLRLGRFDEALAQLVEAASQPEHGQPNVSQVLNLAVLQCAMQRPDEALSTLERVGTMSGYGRMVMTLVQQCAAIQRKNPQAADTALATLRSEYAESPGVLLEGLLRVGRLDEAAKVQIAWLDSTDRRGEALASVQDYRDVPKLPGEFEYDAHLEQLLARDDVQAAIRRAGRVLSVPIYSLE